MRIDRRTLLTRGLGVAAGAATVTTVRAQTAAPEPLPLKRGMNLWPWFSLTREFPAPRTDYDWPPFQAGRPVPTAADLARLKSLGSISCGFPSIRGHSWRRRRPSARHCSAT